MSEVDHINSPAHLLTRGQYPAFSKRPESALCIDRLIRQSNPRLVFFPLQLSVSVCNTTSPWASLCRERITSENRLPVPPGVSQLCRLAEHKVLVCLNLLKNRASQSIISLGYQAGTWVAWMVRHARRTDLQNDTRPLRSFLEPPRYSCLWTDRSRKKERKKSPIKSFDLL